VGPQVTYAVGVGGSVTITLVGATPFSELAFYKALIGWRRPRSGLLARGTPSQQNILAKAGGCLALLPTLIAPPKC
jgi:hypothetical protein